MRARVSVFLVIACAAFPKIASAQHLYWSDSQGIHLAKTDATNVRTLIPEAGAYTLALDVGMGYIYWTIPGCDGWCPPTPGEIKRANLDGTAVRTLIVDDEFAVDAFAIDSVIGKLYWGGPNFGDLIYDARISSANTDGSGMRRILWGPHVQWPVAISLDPVGRMLYWSEYFRGLIQRAPVDNPMAYAPVAHMRRGPYDLLVDSAGRHLYWSEGDRIMRSALDGLGAEVVVATGTARAYRVALDPVHGKIYWTTLGSDGADRIMRANLDGTGAERVLSSLYIDGLAVDPRPPGDFDMNSEIDMRDYARFAACLHGADDVLSSPACAFFDIDPSDGDVDLADYLEFQNAMTGPK